MIDTLAIKNNILRLAFSGKLTRQLSSDDSVNDMLSRINSKKSIVQTNNTPYEIPRTWSWVRMADLYKINPKVIANDTDEAAFIPMERITPGFNDNYTYEVQSWAKASKNHTKFEDDDVAFAKISPCFENRKSFVARNLPNGIGGGTTELIILRQPEMFSEYTYFIVSDQRFIHAGASSYKGTVGQQRIQSDVVKNYLVPVPPLAEQIRIVEVIHSAFSILDAIDSLQGEYSNNLKTLKNKLVDAAIQGKLTNHLSADGTAEDLYKHIQEERERQEKEGIIKSVDLTSDIEMQNVPFIIPEHWKWTHLGNVSYIVRGGSPRPIKQYITTREDGINWIKIGDVEKGGKYIDSTNEKIIPEGESKSRKVYPGDFLLTNSMSFGRPYISRIEGCIHDGWLLIRNLDGFDPDYLYFLLSSTYLYGQFTDKASGSTVDNLNIDKVKAAIIPLPPLAEQQRIAKRIEEVLGALT